MIELRRYQTDLVAGIRAEFSRHRRVLAVAPTGAGKTVTFAYITTNAAAKGNRVYIVAHRAEIVEQISAALDAMGVRHGRIQPRFSMTDDAVQVAMIQTLARRLEKIPEPKLLVVDEAHHAVAGTWKTVAEAWPATKILGVTATPQRLDGRGLEQAFDAMVIGPNMAELIETGFLARYRYLAPPQKADLSAVKTRMGDFAIDELAAAMDRPVITGDAVANYQQHLAGRPAIAFCVTVKHAEHVAAQFREAGISAASVDGGMDRAVRRDVVASLADGRIRVMTSCELVSEGFDLPAVAGAILLRPTQSVAMFLQQVGRALRPKPDGGAAVIIDHVGNVHRHGMPDAPREWSLKTRKKKSAPGVSQCEKCYRVFTSKPGWKATADCPEGRPVECILNAPEESTIGKSAPEQVDGELEEISRTPAWAGGADIVLARGPEFAALIDRADTHEKLKIIAKMRGYHYRWVGHILASRVAA